MSTIIEVLKRVMKILETIEIRPSEYNKAALQQCYNHIYEVVSALEIAAEKPEESEEKAQ